MDMEWSLTVQMSGSIFSIAISSFYGFLLNIQGNYYGV
jgi:hypothetical protein